MKRTDFDKYLGRAMRPFVGVGVMMIRDGKVLLGRRKGAHGEGTFGWAGGHLELGETLEECAVREVFEETGIKVKELKFLCLSNIIEYGKHYVDIEFLCTDISGDPELNEPEKIEVWGWYPLDKLPKPLFKAVELAINSYNKQNVFNP